MCHGVEKEKEATVSEVKEKTNDSRKKTAWCREEKKAMMIRKKRRK